MQGTHAFLHSNMESVAALESIEENTKNCYDRINKDETPVYHENVDYKMGVSLGFKYETDMVFGVPERKSNFKLADTLGFKQEISDPYRFFNRDVFRP